MSHLLLIDDDDELSGTLKEVLELESFSVTAVATGSDALKIMHADQYDLILLDWQLEDMQGIDVLKEYRRAGGLSRVVMLTGRRDPQSQQAGKDAGADDFLTKPFTLEQLLDRLAANLAGNR